MAPSSVAIKYPSKSLRSHRRRRKPARNHRISEELSIREGCSAREFNRCITLAYLSPKLEAAVTGALPRGVGVATLHGLPAEWNQQHAAFGLKV